MSSKTGLHNIVGISCEARSIINHPLATLSRHTQTFYFADDGKAKGATLRENPYKRIFHTGVVTHLIPRACPVQCHGVANLKCP